MFVDICRLTWLVLNEIQQLSHVRLCSSLNSQPPFPLLFPFPLSPFPFPFPFPLSPFPLLFPFPIFPSSFPLLFPFSLSLSSFLSPFTLSLSSFPLLFPLYSFPLLFLRMTIVSVINDHITMSIPSSEQYDKNVRQ